MLGTRVIKQATVIALISVLLVTVGCGNERGNTGAGSKNGSQSIKGQTITIEAGQAMKTGNPYVFDQTNIDNFEKKYGVKVRLIIDPDNQVKNILQTKISTKTAPDVIVYNKVAAENDLNAKNTMISLNNEPWVKRLKNPKLLKAQDGNIYGFAMQRPIDAQGIVYNKDIFKKLGLSVPTSYNEFLKVCAKIKQAGIQPIYAPFNDAWTFQIWPSASFGYYAEKVKPGLWKQINSGKVKWTDVKAFQDILQRALNLEKKGYISNSALSDSYNMAPDVFSKGQAAMMIMGDWFISDMAKKDPKLNLGLFPIPAFNGVKLNISQGQLGGVLYIPKSAKHQDAAKTFINFISQKQQMDQAQKTQPFLPSVTDASAPHLTKIQQVIYNQYIKKGRVNTEMNAYMKVDLTDLWKYYQDMFSGQKTPKQVLQSWDQKFSELMKAAGQPGF